MHFSLVDHVCISWLYYQFSIDVTWLGDQLPYDMLFWRSNGIINYWICGIQGFAKSTSLIWCTLEYFCWIRTISAVQGSLESFLCNPFWKARNSSMISMWPRFIGDTNGGWIDVESSHNTHLEATPLESSCIGDGKVFSLKAEFFFPPTTIVDRKRYIYL